MANFAPTFAALIPSLVRGTVRHLAEWPILHQHLQHLHEEGKTFRGGVPDMGVSPYLKT